MVVMIPFGCCSVPYAPGPGDGPLAYASLWPTSVPHDQRYDAGLEFGGGIMIPLVSDIPAPGSN